MPDPVPDIDRRPGAPPVYVQIATLLRRDIEQGRYPVGAQLPPRRELAEQYNVEHPTVDKAVGELRAAGLVETRPGRGVFVVSVPRVHRRARLRIGQQARGLAWRGFYADVAAGGGQARGQTTVSSGPAPEHIAALLGLEPGTKVLIRDRVMSDDQGPLQLATSWFAPAAVDAAPRLAEQDTGPGGMYARLEEAGYQLAQEVINRVRMPTGLEAEALALPPSTPIFDDLWVTSAGAAGPVLEVSNIRARGDRMQFVYEL